jgi:hypothetical protein
VGIARTNRVLPSENIIHKVVFASFVRTTHAFWNDVEYPLCERIREGIEIAAIAQKCEVIYVYSPSFASHWKNRWTIHTQQKRKIYMYNRIPPSLGHSSILWPHAGL